MDKISLTGIRGYGYLGVLPEEQVLGQWFEVDLVLGLDLTLPGQSDRLADTIDYGAVVQMVQDLIKTCRFALLERLADEIATTILDRNLHPSVAEVQVSVTKLTAPIPDFSGKVTIELTRQRC